jgi:large subunit ribosomal protein L18e
MKTAKTNTNLIELSSALYKFSSENKLPIWRRVADDLLMPTRKRRLVNLFTLDLYSKDGDIVVVPGKVLGTGDINHKVTVAAYAFSSSAIAKIRQAKVNVMSIKDLVEKNPKGKDVRILA